MDGLRRASLTALAMAVLGFGGLLVLWLTGDHDPRLPGLWSFPSVWIGDAVLLPAFTAGLILAASALPPRTDPAARRWVTAAATLGLLAGAATQAAWLADPDPAPNWAFPSAGHFSAAGWWHAAYLTVFCSLLAGLAALVAVRARGRLTAGRPFTLVVLLIGHTFWWLLLRDSLAGPATASTVASVAGVLLAYAIATAALLKAAGAGTIVKVLLPAAAGSAVLTAMIVYALP